MLCSGTYPAYFGNGTKLTVLGKNIKTLNAIDMPMADSTAQFAELCKMEVI